MTNEKKTQKQKSKLPLDKETVRTLTPDGDPNVDPQPTTQACISGNQCLALHPKPEPGPRKK